MMPFLQQLAPPDTTQSRRAYALLPARFAQQRPIDDLPEPAHLDLAAGAVPTWPEIDWASAAQHRPGPETLAGAAAHGQARQTPGDDAPAGKSRYVQGASAQSRTDARPASSTAPSPRAMSAPSLHARPLQDGTERARRDPDTPAAPAAHARGTQLSLPQSSQPSAPLASLRQPAAPLSPATLAQRIVPPNHDEQVVHVTIGRIDVVATTPPAPAAKPARAARQEPTTLADYLRGAGRGRP